MVAMNRGVQPTTVFKSNKGWLARVWATCGPCMSLQMDRAKIMIRKNVKNWSTSVRVTARIPPKLV